MRFPEFTDEWKECKISDYGTVVTGSTPSTKDVENYEDDGFLWASPADIDGSKFIERTKITLSSKGFNRTRKLPPLSVLVVCIGSIGKIAIAKNEMATNQQINSIVVNPLHSPGFVYYAIISRFRSYLSAVAVQVVPIISKSTFERLPNSTTSLPEQKKIAALLSLIDERIEVQNAIIKEQEAQKAALLRRLFDRTLRFPEFTDEWKKVKLGEVGKMYNGLSGKKAADFGAGYPFITYKMVFDSGVIDMSKVSYVEIGPGEKQNKVREGDIFFTTSSETIDEVGMSSVLLRDADNLFLNSFCFGYRLNTPNLTTSQYLGYMLRGPQMRMRISSLGQGITRFNISKEKVADLQIAIPSLAEQKKIAALLSAIDERIAVEKEYAAFLQKQKAYLLRQMFV